MHTLCLSDRYNRAFFFFFSFLFFFFCLDRRSIGRTRRRLIGVAITIVPAATDKVSPRNAPTVIAPGELLNRRETITKVCFDFD